MSKIKDYAEDEFESDVQMYLAGEYETLSFPAHRSWISIDNDQKAELVFLSNMLVRNREAFGLDIYQAKMLYYLISKIKKDDKEFKEEVIPFADYMRLMGIPRAGYYYDAIDVSISKLMKLSFFIIDEAEKTTKHYRWIQSGCKVDRNNRIIRIQLDKMLEPFLLNLEKEFTAFELGFISNMKSKYAIHLYEYLHSMVNLNRPVHITKHRFAKEFADDKYHKSTELMNRIIKPAIDEINLLTDLTVDYGERKKKARNGKLETVGYSFKVKEKNWKDKESLIDTWDISEEKKAEIKKRPR